MQFNARASKFALVLSSGVALLFAPLLAEAQSRHSGGLGPDTSILVVHVQDSYGGLIATEAIVKLTSSTVAWDLTATSHDGIATFRNIPTGDYEVEIAAPGYSVTRDEVSVTGIGETQAFVTISGTGEDTAKKPHPGVPILTGKARKDLDAAVKALQENQLADASEHINSALKEAPAHPDIQYVAALIALAQKNPAAAQKYYEAAINIYPNHLGAQIGLGSMLLDQRNAAAAIPHLEKAIELSANSWRAHWLVAEAYLDAGQSPEKAKSNARRALELDAQKALDAQVTVARAEIALSEKDAARTDLEKFVHDYPDRPTTARARILLRRLNAPDVADAVAAVRATLNAPASSESAVPGLNPNLTEPLPLSSIVTLPANTDDAVPVVDPTVSCSLPQVLDGAARRIGEFIDGIERFTAQEEVIHDELDATGAKKKTYDHTFQYLATVDHPRADSIVLDESRDGTSELSNFPAPMAVEGLPAIGLIFHQNYAGDFSFTCEGLGHWNGQPAWQVRFEQRPDKPPRIHDWVVQGQRYSTMLKGRAWISTSSFRLLHIQTDLAKPIPQIKLDYQHMEIDYKPVTFRNGAAQLWLPSSAEVYSRYKGHFFRQEHDFSDFLLYTVDATSVTSAKDHP